jgi:hypothetical protein
MEEVGVRRNYDEIFADAAEPKSIDEIAKFGFNIKPVPQGARLGRIRASEGTPTQAVLDERHPLKSVERESESKRVQAALSIE